MYIHRICGVFWLQSYEKYHTNTHEYPGHGYITNFYPSMKPPGYPLSIEVCLDPRLGFSVFRPFVTKCWLAFAIIHFGLAFVSIHLFFFAGLITILPCISILIFSILASGHLDCKRNGCKINKSSIKKNKDET